MAEREGQTENMLLKLRFRKGLSLGTCSLVVTTGARKAVAHTLDGRLGCNTQLKEGCGSVALRVRNRVRFTEAGSCYFTCPP